MGIIVQSIGNVLHVTFSLGLQIILQGVEIGELDLLSQQGPDARQAQKVFRIQGFSIWRPATASNVKSQVVQQLIAQLPAHPAKFSKLLIRIAAMCCLTVGGGGPALKDFDICGDRDRFDVFRVTDTRSAPPRRQKLLVCPVVGGRELAVADRDRRRVRLK